MTLNKTTCSPEETRRLGVEIGSKLKGHEILCLYGDVGSGKTCMSQGIINGANPDCEPYPRSPTYSIINPCDGTFPLHHIDLYRLETEEELIDIGFEELLHSGGALIIEWAEKLKGLRPDKRVDIFFTVIDDNSRNITIAPIQCNFTLP